MISSLYVNLTNLGFNLSFKFQKTVDPIHKKIYEKSVFKNDKLIFPDDKSAIQATCKTKNFVFFGALSVMGVTYKNAKMPCVLLPLKLEISAIDKTIAVSKNSPFRYELKSQ